MKNATQKQIEQIKSIKTWSSTRFHGNTKKVGSLPIEVYKEIVAKKYRREILALPSSNETPPQTAKRLLKWSLECINTSYFKVMIEGNKNIYYASPIYQHSDYNKSRLFPKTEKNLRIMDLFNSILNKKTTPGSLDNGFVIYGFEGGKSYCTREEWNQRQERGNSLQWFVDYANSEKDAEEKIYNLVI